MLTSILNNLGEIILAILAIFGAVFGYLAQKHAKEANKAVNGNKNPEAVRLYDLVLNIDSRTDRLEDWMIRHKGESNSRDDRIEKLDKDIMAKIEKFGCPVRLHQRKTPLCVDKNEAEYD